MSGEHVTGDITTASLVEDGTPRRKDAVVRAWTPARKRAALETLRAERLRELARHLEAEPESFRERSALITTLADGRSIDFHQLLREVTVTEFEEMCSAASVPITGADRTPSIQQQVAVDEGDTAEPRFDETERDRRHRVPAITAGEKWTALEVLRADRLREIARDLDVKVESYRDREALIAGLADGRRVGFRDILDCLSREELKAMCDGLELDSRGREKEPIIQRLLRGRAGSDSVDGSQLAWLAEDDDDDDERQGREPAAERLRRLVGADLLITSEGKGWPSAGRIYLPDGAANITVYVRNIGRSGRGRPTERRFQNPADKNSRPIRSPQDGYVLLVGVWTEQGESRAVLVGMDAYRRFDQDRRISLFMPLSLLEEAADTGWAEHRSQSGETIFAFRPSNLVRYVEHMQLEMGLRQRRRTQDDGQARTISIGVAPAQLPGLRPDRSLHIRPRVGMYAAFARLNYKPWFAIAEFVDNAIQSFIAGPLRGSGEPLLIDIRIDEGEIVITDRAGGIAEADFPRAFSPSQPPPDASGLSEFGLGMKAAACWFARQWSVRTSALGDPVERLVEFDIPRITREGIEQLTVAESPTPSTSHFTVVRLTDLRVVPRGQTLGKIKRHLASIYRVLVRDGIVRIRLSTQSASEELRYAEPKLLVAPHFREPDGAERTWKTTFDIPLGDSKRVHGWAGLLDTGSVSEAGFAVFRRGRLIQGSVDDSYRPADLFKKPNSYTYQRLVGELHVDGFNVSHTKDGIQWDDLEDMVISKLRAELSRQDLPLLQQAEGYRARRKVRDLEQGFGQAAIASTAASLSTEGTGEAVARLLKQGVSDPEPATPAKHPPREILTKRTFKVDVPGTMQPWCLTLEMVSDQVLDWYGWTMESKLEERSISIYVNLAHPFSEQFINDQESTVGPLVRLVCAMVLAEATAREAGFKYTGEIRRRVNDLLRKSLGSVAREIADLT